MKHVQTDECHQCSVTRRPEPARTRYSLSNSSPFLKGCEELAYALNRHPPEAPESQQVLVTAQDDPCIRRNGAFENAVVRWVSIQCVDTLGGRDDAGDDPQLLVSLSEFLGCGGTCLSGHEALLQGWLRKSRGRCDRSLYRPRRPRWGNQLDGLRERADR